MRIKWYGTASLLIEGNGSRVLVDPYLRKFNKKLPPIPVEEAATADAIFISHPHFDHFRDISAFIKGNVKAVYVSQNGINIARKRGTYSNMMVPLTAGEEVRVGNITVRTYLGRHCKFDIATVLGVVLNPLTYTHPLAGFANIGNTRRYKMDGEEDIFALEISCGGKKIMVLGSAGMDKNTEYPLNADLLVFPYQGRTRMHKYIMPFLETFRPRAVMLDHFDNAFPPFTHSVNTKKFLSAVEERFPEVRAFVPKENEWYEI